MGDTVPPGQRLDRAALERVILRAAQIQAGTHDLDDGLTEEDLLRLGSEVGIPALYLRQALLEERTRVAVPGERGVRVWLAGPRWLVAERTIPGPAAEVRHALEHWMATAELLAVKRRFPDKVAWEPQKGAWVSIRRSFAAGGRSYRLAEAREVVGHVTEVAPDRSHVRLVADLGNTQQGYLAGATVLALAGAAAAGVLLLLGFAEFVAVPLAPAGLLGGGMAARSRISTLEKFQTALEQVLDRLEHGEIRVPGKPGSRDDNPLTWIAKEIRKQLKS
jgi:hypothetical protein